MPDARLIDSNANFAAFSHILDARVLRALADLGFAKPTLVQTKAIPLALENRDILARARTGSGKTAAYCIPVVQKILNAKSVSCTTNRLHALLTVMTQNLDISDGATRALILVPTRELSEQVHGHLRSLLKYCESEIAVANVCSGTTNHLQR